MRHLHALWLVFVSAWPSPACAADLQPAHIQAAAAYSASHSQAGLLIQQHGKTLFASESRTLHRIYSGTKGFWMLAALHAAEAGILDFDDRVSEMLPEWQSDGRKAHITVRQLLNFTSGLEPLFGLHENVYGDRNRAALKASMVAEPGTRFIYGPASLQVFEELFRRKLAARQDTPTRYLERHVLKPLGLGSQRYLADKAGNPLLATGFILAPFQWAKEGQLLLNNGKPVISKSGLAECLRGSSANRSFGIGFWNNQAAGAGAREIDVEEMLDRKWYDQDWRSTCLCRDAPTDLIAAIGSGYQRLFVIPSFDLVVVRNGSFGKFSDGTFLRLLLGK